MQIKIVSLGCSKNLYDSEKLAAQFQGEDFSVTFKENDPADVVIINTCGFIGDAKQESINTILEYIDKKKKGEVKKIYVMGCLAHRYKDELKSELPETDGIFSLKETNKILSELKTSFKPELDTQRILSTPSHYGYLKIAEGCNRTCSFCAIPLIKGKYISTPIEKLVEEAKNMADKGVKELILIAQDITLYGTDIYKKQALADLIRKLAEIEQIKWIRLHYAYPESFPSDVIELMATENKICKYIDIPLQHCSDRILKSMKRGSTKQKTDDLLNKLRTKIPDIAIRTTLIVGYPGETKEEFEELKDWVKAQRFDRLGVFTYCEEENTPAAQLEDNIDEDEKNARMAEIMQIQQDISLSKNEEKIGKKIRAVIDKQDDDFFIGRTEYDSPEVDCDVFIDKSQFNVPIGEFVNIIPTSVGVYDIFATPVP